MELKQRGKDGIYHVRFTAPNGRRIRRSTGTNNLRQAKEFADRLKSQLWRQQSLGERKRRTWKEAVVRWVKETGRKRTHADDVAKINWLHTYLGELMLDEITSDVLAMIRGEVLSGKTPNGGRTVGTLNNYLALIRAILRRARDEWEWIDRMPKVRLDKRPQAVDRILWLRHDQADELMRRLRQNKSLSHVAAMVEFTLQTGLRSQNCMELEWSRVDLSRRVAWIEDTKNGHALSVPLNDTAVAVLRACRFNHQTRVFTYRGKPISYVNSPRWRRVLSEMGLRPRPDQPKHPANFRWHDLRHTWASWHVQAGTPLKVLQELGGWRSFDMVLRYSHLTSGHVAEYAGQVESRGREEKSGPNSDQAGTSTKSG